VSQTVTAAATTPEVPAAFDRASARYDVMVSLNPGYHRHLRTAAASLAAGLPPGEERPLIVDLGCGSGASTRAVLTMAPQAEVIGVDASSGMLHQARAKAWPAGVRFVHGYAEDLARRSEQWGLTRPAAGIFAAYLFRNVRARDAVVQAAYARLRPGGALVIQEYSVAGSPGATAVWSAICWLVVIPLSILTRAHPAIYRYLWRSVLRNESIGSLADRLRAAGFVEVQTRTVAGWQRGILHTIRARRPA
jgi:ubiquinone/menaquinone biosynthesis C-methylase UbiE